MEIKYIKKYKNKVYNIYKYIMIEIYEDKNGLKKTKKIKYRIKKINDNDENNTLNINNDESYYYIIAITGLLLYLYNNK
tara:strand:- start:868 stop:1104 length:237 start_codon:yes stop_codon:yes gene_type:complete